MKSRREFVLDASLGAIGVGFSPESSELESKGKRNTGFVSHDIYQEHVISPGHPESPERLRRILVELKTRGLEQELLSIKRVEDPKTNIEGHHKENHVSAIRNIPTTGAVAEAAVGGALAAVKAVAEGRVNNAFCAVRPPGHHANNTGQEEGFCFYSNAAIAAKYAQQVHGYQKILIVDWDYHHGNATQNAFYDDPSVLFFSTHDWQAYPGTGDPSLGGTGEAKGLNINVHLDCGSGDADMLASWERQLLPAATKFRPDFVLISAGFDSRKDDLLGCFEVTDNAFRRMTGIVMDIADDFCDGRVVSILEGGYNVDGTALAAAAHVETLINQTRA